jgi:hypothetical protein
MYQVKDSGRNAIRFFDAPQRDGAIPVAEQNLSNA